MNWAKGPLLNIRPEQMPHHHQLWYGNQGTHQGGHGTVHDEGVADPSSIKDREPRAR